MPAAYPEIMTDRLGASHSTFAAILALTTLLSGCASRPPNTPAMAHSDLIPAPVEYADVASLAIVSPSATRRPPFDFSAADRQLLDDVQRGAFNFLWAHCDPAKGCTTGMVPDRATKPVVSVAGVGFQLSAIPVGVERGWITRDQGLQRTLLILRSLRDAPENRKAGLFYHYLDPHTAPPTTDAYEHTVSTIDSAILFAGILTASQYFGGEVASVGDALFTDADWSFFISSAVPDPKCDGYISLGWKPRDAHNTTGDGSLLPYAWIDNGDEHRLVTFLAVCAPIASHRVDPALYYKLRRQLGHTPATGTMVWFPWSGALFASFFAHCWIDYAGMPTPDQPAAFDVPRRSRVDWWENSRRHVMLHQHKAHDFTSKFGGDPRVLWGLTASDVARGYAVPGVFPDRAPMPGAIEKVDYYTETAKDDLGDGTIAPYSAGSAIMFDPARALEAMRSFRSMTRPDGTPMVWSDPSTGGYGFADAFNLSTGWVAPDHVAIDQGPLILAIENARTGLLWRLFHAHPMVRKGMERLQLRVERELR
jgi:hypothetical protein